MKKDYQTTTAAAGMAVPDIVIAMGIDVTGVKHPRAVSEGDSENATVLKDLLVSLRDRGLDMSRPILVVIDGANALGKSVSAKIRVTYHSDDALRAEAERNLSSRLRQVITDSSVRPRLLVVC